MSTSQGRTGPLGLPEWDRCAVMGVVNVTPDSFSDGGRWFDPELAVKHGLDLVAQGADLVDVGGESTRPGAARVDEAEELRRVIPVVRELAAAGVLVSVDTMRASVAEQAVAAGARMVNDVSGGLADPGMIPVVAAADVPFVVMHWRGQSIDMNNRAVYADVLAEVVAELRTGLERAVAGGVAPERIVLDPGLGFAKNAEHDLTLARPPRGPARAGPPAAGRRLPQAVPRQRAGDSARAPRRRPASATPRPPRSPPSPPARAPGRCGCTRCTPAPTRSGSPARSARPPRGPRTVRTRARGPGGRKMDRAGGRHGGCGTGRDGTDDTHGRDRPGEGTA